MAGWFLLEIRRETQSALLVIREAVLPSSPVDVSVAADCVEVRSGRSCEAAALPAEVRLAPSSGRGLRRLPGDGLHLRLRLRRPPPGPDLGYTLRKSLKPQKNYNFYCQSCGDIIVRDRKFLRVLSLPSENWSVLVEEWCCHPNPFARSILHPQHDDCFLGDTFFLLNSGSESHVPASPMCSSETGHYASQSSSNLKSKENTRAICKRCRRLLGETLSSDTVKYYVTEVIIQPAEGSFNPIPRSQFVQSMVAQCLLELSSAKSTFRFTVKGDNGKIYILVGDLITETGLYIHYPSSVISGHPDSEMWLLNSDTLLVESLGSSSSHSVFTLFGDNFMPSCGPVESWNAVKVLYQPCVKSRNKDLADAWEDDIGVHPLKFPSETCLELLLILGLSTTSLPPSLRYMNSFQSHGGWKGPLGIIQSSYLLNHSQLVMVAWDHVQLDICTHLQGWRLHDLPRQSKEGCLFEDVKNADTYVKIHWQYEQNEGVVCHFSYLDVFQNQRQRELTFVSSTF